MVKYLLNGYEAWGQFLVQKKKVFEEIAKQNLKVNMFKRVTTIRCDGKHLIFFATFSETVVPELCSLGWPPIQ